MDRVYAEVEGGLAQYLSNERQMDEMLEKGATLYVVHDDNVTELLATPTDGYLMSKPKITVTMRIGGTNSE